MLSYGQIVKLTKPQKLQIRSHFKNIIPLWRSKYKHTVRIKNDPNSYNDQKIGMNTFYIPEGTLGILTLAYVAKDKSAFFITLPHPITGSFIGKNNTLTLDAPDFTINITDEEKAPILKAHAEVLLHRMKDANVLNTIERIHKAQNFDIKNI